MEKESTIIFEKIEMNVTRFGQANFKQILNKIMSENSDRNKQAQLSHNDAFPREFRLF